MIGKHLSHYLIESELGRGGMGIVYLACDTKLDRQVAIKVLSSAALASDDDSARFYHEAKQPPLSHTLILPLFTGWMRRCRRERRQRNCVHSSQWNTWTGRRLKH